MAAPGHLDCSVDVQHDCRLAVGVDHGQTPVLGSKDVIGRVVLFLLGANTFLCNQLI